MVEVLILKKRKDFVRVASKGLKMVTSGLILQAAQNLCAKDENCRLGYTATKKLGKAHLRNRTKRRLRAAAGQIFPQNALPNTDYVLIGRYNTASCDFSELRKNMFDALKRINKLLTKEATDEKTDLPASDSAC